MIAFFLFLFMLKDSDKSKTQDVGVMVSESDMIHPKESVSET